MKTIGIVGSRRRDSTQDYLAVKAGFLRVYEEGDRIVSGGCPKGGDKFANFLAKDMGLTIITHYPGMIGSRRDYHLRNTKIAMDADILIACVSPDRKGGTEDTIDKFQQFKHKDPILV